MRGFSEILSSFFFIIFLIIALVLALSIATVSNSIKFKFADQTQEFKSASDSYNIIVSCLGNLSSIDGCLPQNFVGGYINGFLIKEEYGIGCDQKKLFGNNNSDQIVYWVNENNCLDKLIIYVK